jgi:hypothetical protein
MWQAGERGRMIWRSLIGESILQMSGNRKYNYCARHRMRYPKGKKCPMCEEEEGKK